MKRKIVSVLVCAAMVATMAVGCGSSSTDTSSDAAATTEDAAAEEDAAATEDAAAEEDAAATDDAAAADGDVITVGFAQVGHESDWRTASTQSCQDVFSAENGYDLQFVDCDNDSAVQLEAVRGFIEQQVDYIIIDPIVTTGWDMVLTECEDAGIPVIVIDRTIEDSDKYVAWVGTDSKAEGLAAGEWLKAYAEAKDISELNILVIEGTTGASAQIGRTEGFNEIAEREGWNIIDSQTGDFTQEGGQTVMESYCKSYEGQFNVVVCQNDNEAFGAMDAMTAAGVSYGVDGDVILISFDGCRAALEYAMDGQINVVIECNPMAAPIVEEVIQALEAGEEPVAEQYVPGSYFTGDDSVTSIEVNGEAKEMTIVTPELLETRPF